MELYSDFYCKKIADDYYLVFKGLMGVGEKIEIGGFCGKDIFIYPKYKGLGYGYLIRLFMKDVGAV